MKKMRPIDSGSSCTMKAQLYTDTTAPNCDGWLSCVDRNRRVTLNLMAEAEAVFEQIVVDCDRRAFQIQQAAAEKSREAHNQAVPNAKLECAARSIVTAEALVIARYIPQGGIDLLRSPMDILGRGPRELALGGVIGCEGAASGEPQHSGSP